MLAKNNGKTLSGSQVLSLEKKWGFPQLLVEMVLKEKGLEFAKVDYIKALQTWKQNEKTKMLVNQIDLEG